MYSRRRFCTLALGAVPWSAASASTKIDSKVHGIQWGLQSYSFTGAPMEGILDVVIRAMVESGLGECDIYSPQLEPPELSAAVRGGGGVAGRGAPPAAATPGAPDPRAQARERLARWRATAPLSYFRDIRAKFNRAGIDIWGYSGTTGNTDEEIERTFAIAKAMGAGYVTTSATLSQARRIAPLAERHRIRVGFQGRPNMTSTDPDQIRKPQDFLDVVKLSRNFWISLDIGDVTGGGWDPLPFVRDHHERIALLYIKDRKKDNTSMPWGEGETPVKEVLQLVRDRRLPIRCYVDNDYKSPLTRTEDVKRSFEWAKKVLG
jgi:sugar phosphate isomerase/epimerase